MEGLRTDQATLMGWEPMGAGRQSPSSMPEACESACLIESQTEHYCRFSSWGRGTSLHDGHILFIEQDYSNTGYTSIPSLFRRVFTYRLRCIRSIIIASAATLGEEIGSPLFDLWVPYEREAAFEEWL